VRVRRDGRVVVVVIGSDADQRALTLKRPRDDVEARSFRSYGVRRGDDGLVVWTTRCEQVVEGRRDDVDALCLEVRQARDGGGVVCGRVAGLVEEDRVLAEGVVLGESLADVGRVEGLGEGALSVDSAADECPNQSAGVPLLRVAVEGHWDWGGWSLELRGEAAVAWERVGEGNVAVERHERAAGVVALRPPLRGPLLVVLWGLGACVEVVLLATQGRVFCYRDVAGAAECVCG
jgi:hypothetical protein